MRTPFDDDEPEAAEPAVTRQEHAQFVLNRFVELLSKAGGSELPDRCAPVKLSDKLRFKGEDPITTCACGNQTMFALPYEGETGEMQVLRACAICDGGLHFPRITVQAGHGD
jgi:hypothetical protein